MGYLGCSSPGLDEALRRAQPAWGKGLPEGTTARATTTLPISQPGSSARFLPRCSCTRPFLGNHSLLLLP